MYDKFKNRLIKLMKFKNFFLKHIIVFITSFIVAIIGITALLCNVGNMLSFTDENIEVTYGEEYKVQSHTFMSSPHFEYRDINSDEWQEGLPIYPGEYKITSYGKKLNGKREYSNEITCRIYKRYSSIKVLQKELNYGEPFGVEANLARGDKIEDIAYNYKLDGDIVSFIPIKDSIKILDKKGNNVTSCYDLQLITQKTLFKKAKLSIKTSDIEMIYNGEDIDNQSYEITDGFLCYSDKLEVDFKEKGLNGFIKDKNYADFRIVNEHGIDVTKFYNLNVSYGNLDIHHKALFITTDSSIKKDDGLPLSNENYTVDGLLKNHYAYVKNDTVLDHPGTIENKLNIVVYDENNNDVTKNYLFYETLGKLTICPEITITTASNTKEYDGTILYNEDYSINREIPFNHHIKLLSRTELIDHDIIDNVLSFRIFNELDEDVTSYYKINLDYGTLSVTKREMELISNHDKKMYDGQGLDNVSFTTKRLLSNHHVVIKDVLNMDSDVGFYDNKFTYCILDESNRDVTYNYHVNPIWNQKEIYKRDVTIMGKDYTTVYKNAPISYKEVEVKENDLVLDHKVKITQDFNSFIEVNVYKNDFDATIVDGNNNDVSYNYNITIVPGRLKIKQRPIGVITKSIDKQYDKIPIKAEGYTLRSGKDEGILPGHNFIKTSEYKEFVEPGRHLNIIDFVIYDDYGNDVTKNYIGVDFGIVNIIKPQIIVTTGSSKKQYDGKPLTNSFIDIKYDKNLDIYVENEVTGTITYVGKVLNEATIVIRDNEGNDVSEFYQIIENFGILEVTKLENGQLNNGTGNIDNSGQIATKPQNVDSINDKQAFKYSTNCKDKIYFRAFSFGDYAFNKWEQPLLYENDGTSPLYYSSETLNNRYEKKNISITLDEKLDYLLPYYTIDGPSFTNDVNNQIKDCERNYDLTFIPYVYDYRDNMQIPSSLSSEEALYYDFVKENYLKLPQSTKDVMLRVAKDNSLDPNSKNIIFDVQNFFRNNALLNNDFANIPTGVDMAVHFLTKTREGNAQHFATTATCLYRALGIPARYTVGFVSTPSKTIDNVVTWKDAHAWVEVYIPQMGWITTEVCGQVVDTDEDINIPEVETKEILSLKPVDVSREFNNEYLYPYNEIDLQYSTELKELIEKGYTYDVVVSGKQKELGTSPSRIESFTLYDPFHNVVKDKYETIFIDGEIKVTIRQAKFNIISSTKYYDGKGFNITKDEIETILPEGYYATYDLENNDFNRIGETKVTLNNVKIYEKNTNTDVTDTFYINIQGGYLKIKKIPIEITVASDEKEYDGTPLSNNTYRISKGKILEGHTLDIEITNEIVEIGEMINIPSSIKITDENGNNIKFAYEIHVKQGILKIFKAYSR